MWICTMVDIYSSTGKYLSHEIVKWPKKKKQIIRSTKNNYLKYAAQHLKQLE